MDKDERDNKLLRKAEAYSDDVLAFCRELRKRRVENEIIHQLLKAGTSVCANVTEAQRGQGTNDFVSKLEIAEKECDESAYWFHLLYKAGSISEFELKRFRNQWISIQRLIASSCNTAKRNMEEEKKTTQKYRRKKKEKKVKKEKFDKDDKIDNDEEGEE